MTLAGPGTITLRLFAFRSSRDLWSDVLLPQVLSQLKDQGRSEGDSHRYSVVVEVLEGKARPAKDVDNYYKPIIDTITKTRLLWHDDCQVDDVIVRRKVGSQPTTEVTITVTQLRSS